MGIFDNHPEADKLFTVYHARATFRQKVMGATPKHAKIIESWLRTSTGVTDKEEMRQMMRRTMTELGYDVAESATYEEMVQASEGMAESKHAVGFKIGSMGIYLEGRTLKAMLKEAINVVFEGQTAHALGWTPYPATRKFGRAYGAERIFVEQDQVWLGKDEPDGLELFIGHTTGPNGPQSNLTYYEYALRPTIEFDVMVLNNHVPEAHWPRIWRYCQENGLGALRSQGFGRFDIEAWDVDPATLPPKKATAEKAAVTEPEAASFAKANGRAPGRPRKAAVGAPA